MVLVDTLVSAAAGDRSFACAYPIARKGNRTNVSTDTLVQSRRHAPSAVINDGGRA